MKKNGEACGDFKGKMRPVFRCSSMKALQASFSAGLSRYTLAILGTKESLSSMVWSKGQCGERMS